jgi:hypothetical protein
MTLTFEVPPKLAQRVEKVRSSGVDVDTLFAQWVETLPSEDIEEAERLARIDAAYGKFAGHGSSDDILADRRADMELERQRLENR